VAVTRQLKLLFHHADCEMLNCSPISISADTIAQTRLIGLADHVNEVRKMGSERSMTVGGGQPQFLVVGLTPGAKVSVQANPGGID
jgi:hypothetical protein